MRGLKVRQAEGKIAEWLCAALFVGYIAVLAYGLALR